MSSNQCPSRAAERRVRAVSDREVVEARVDELLAQFADPPAADVVAFRGAQYDLGLAWVHFEEGHGGLGVAAGLQPVVDERLRAVGAPARNSDFIAMHQVAAAINAVGTHEQKA